MPKIPPSKSWTSLDDDAARDFEQVNATNVRQASSARTMTNLAHAVNHLAARNPRKMFAASQHIDVADGDGLAPLYEWRYEDSVDNGHFYEFTIVSVPRTLASNAISNAGQYASANSYDAKAITQQRNVTAPSVNKYFDAFFETFSVNRDAKLTDEVIDGLSTYNGYKVLHVGVQEKPLYWLDTDDHIYCDPTLAKKGEKILADAAEDVRSTFHTLRSTNLPIVAQWSEQGETTNARAHTNTVLSNLFDNTYGTARNSDTPGATYDAQYCARGSLDQRAQANVKVFCRIKANTTMATANVANVMFWGPQGNVVVPVPSNGFMAWHGNSDHFLYLDANVPGTTADATANKIDILAAVHGASDYLNWKAFDCWVDYE